jgi:hypothetical protein
MLVSYERARRPVDFDCGKWLDKKPMKENELGRMRLRKTRTNCGPQAVCRRSLKKRAPKAVDVDRSSGWRLDMKPMSGFEVRYNES